VGKLALVRDSARRNAVLALGWTVLTATPRDLRDGARVLAPVVGCVLARAAPRADLRRLNGNNPFE
jgi:hypothetical protein